MTAAVPTLETQRLVLRAWRADDIGAFAAMSADPVLMRYLGGPVDELYAFRRMAVYVGHWILRGYGTFALEDKASGRLAGYSGIYDPRADWPAREINWGLARDFLGRGLATEAATRVRTFAYETLGFETIASCIDMENEPSLAVARRLGATHERTADFRGRPFAVYRHVTPAACRAERERS